MTTARIAHCALTLSILSVASNCSTPAGLVATRPTAINEAPADPYLAANLEAFMEDHKSGWRKAPSILNLAPAIVSPRTAPENYVLIEDGAGRRFSYGYLNGSLIRKRGIGGNYYYKDVAQSEIYRLKGLLDQVPTSTSSAYVAHSVLPPTRHVAPAPAAAVASQVTAQDAVAIAEPVATPAPTSSTVPISTAPSAPTAAAKPDAKLAYLRSIWPKHSTLTPTTVGLKKPGYVYTGAVDDTTIQENETRYEDQFGEKLYLRKFGW